MTHLMRYATVLLVLLITTQTAAGTLEDWETGTATIIDDPGHPGEDALTAPLRPVTGFQRYWEAHYGGSTLSMVSPGLLGSLYGARSYVAAPDSSHYSYLTWHEGETQGVIIYEAADANRFSLYALFSQALTPDDDNSFHVGTYTNQAGTSSNGVHYYHLFRPYSDGVHPTHFMCNEHPQNLSGSGIEVPNDPETWDYMPGWTRFYLQLVEEDQPSTAFSIYYDDLVFSSTSEQENDETINSIWVGYMGSNNWRMGFAINCQHTTDCSTKSHTFQVRYSASPITNANFSSATLAGNFNFDASTYNQVPISFAISPTDESGTTHYYFAIQDTDEAYSDYVSKIDYEFSSSSTPTITGGFGGSLQ